MKRESDIVKVLVIIVSISIATLNVRLAHPNQSTELSEANEWIEIATMTSPSPRTRHAMAFDSLLETVVLFGGCNGTPKFGGASLSDTWLFSFESNTWTMESPSISPSAREEHAMAYDSKNNEIVLFGGATEGMYGTEEFGDTWVYDVASNVWIEKSPTLSPMPRFRHVLVYDSDLEKVLLFGGFNFDDGYLNDVWMYDVVANTWTSKSPSGSSPSGRYGAGVYDDHSKELIVFGGASGSEVYNDTWAYNTSANEWHQKNPQMSPASRFMHSMVFDRTSNLTLLFGGFSNYPPDEKYYNDTWVYDSETDNWTELIQDTTPSPRASHVMVFDPILSAVWLFGGYAITDSTEVFDDTWAYGDSTVIPEYSSSPIPALSIIATLSAAIVCRKKRFIAR